MLFKAVPSMSNFGGDFSLLVDIVPKTIGIECTHIKIQISRTSRKFNSMLTWLSKFYEYC